MLLKRLIGLIVVVGGLAVVGFAFWSAMHPQTPAVSDELRSSTSTPANYYSLEGGHNPVRKPATTRDELRFRGFDLDAKYDKK